MFENMFEKNSKITKNVEIITPDTCNILCNPSTATHTRYFFLWWYAHNHTTNKLFVLRPRDSTGMAISQLKLRCPHYFCQKMAPWPKENLHPTSFRPKGRRKRKNETFLENRAVENMEGSGKEGLLYWGLLGFFTLSASSRRPFDVLSAFWSLSV